MTIRDVSLWLLNVGSMKSAHCAEAAPVGGGFVRAAAGRCVVLVTALLYLASAEAMAQALAHASVKRSDDPMFRIMWSPPPPDAPWIMNEAQWGLPSAPFVFSGDTLFIGGSFKSARPISIKDQARIHTAPDVRFHLSGVIAAESMSSTAGLVKDGAGTLVLSGQNNYRGNTIVEEGTLHVEGDMALGLQVRTLEMYGGTTLSYGDGATLFNSMQLREQAGADSLTWRVDTGAARQVGPVNGSVPIIKKGAGTLVVAGFVTLPSSAIIEEGSLSVSHTFSGSVQVNRGARLEGGGIEGSGRGIVGDVMVLDGGVLSPGVDANPSTLSVTRSLELKPGAALEVDVGPDGAADRVHVGGKALLAGDVKARAASGDWKLRTDYTIVRAEAGFDGTQFDAATTNLPFLQASLSYDQQEVTLRLDRNETPLEEVAETPTEEEVADAVEASENPVLIDRVVRMDAGQAREAFNELSGGWSASVLSSVLEDSRFVREAALRNGAHGEAALGHAAGPAGFWHEAFFSSADRRAQGALPADGRDTGGLVLGRTHDLNPAWRTNAFLAVQRSDLKQRREAGAAILGNGDAANQQSVAGMADRAGATATLDSAHVGLGLGGRWRGVDLAMGTAYAWHKIRSQRRLAIAGLHETLTGRYSAQTLQWFAEISAPFRWLGAQGKALAERAKQGPPYTPAAPVLEPYLRLAWVQASAEGYTEHGGAAALRVQAERRGVLFSGLGLKVKHVLDTPQGTARLSGEAGWRHASGDVRAWSRQRFHEAVTARTFASEGHAVARQAWLLRLAAQGDLTRRLKLGVAYDGQFSRGVQDHGARLDLRWTF
jgi:outer membrane autotransporter protein